MFSIGSDFTIRPEVEIDRPHIRDVHAAAFGDETVPRLVDALRSTPAAIAPMSYVAVSDDRVMGHVMMSAGRLDAPRRIVNVLVLSPLGVLPTSREEVSVRRSSGMPSRPPDSKVNLWSFSRVRRGSTVRAVSNALPRQAFERHR